MSDYVKITQQDLEHMTVSEIIAYEIWLSEQSDDYQS